MIETVKLKNGTEEARPLVGVTMMSIRGLMGDLEHGGPIALYELVEICKDRDHKPFGNTGDKLAALSLATPIANSDGRFQVHNSIKNIVLSAVEGEGMEMSVGDPVAPVRSLVDALPPSPDAD